MSAMLAHRRFLRRGGTQPVTVSHEADLSCTWSEVADVGKRSSWCPGTLTGPPTSNRLTHPGDIPGETRRARANPTLKDGACARPLGHRAIQSLPDTRAGSGTRLPGPRAGPGARLSLVDIRWTVGNNSDHGSPQG